MRELSAVAALLLSIAWAIGPTKATEHNITVDTEPPTLAVEKIKASLSWRMEPRFEAGWQAYNARTHTYDPRYVRPDFVAVDLDACGSRGGDGSAIREISIEIVRTDDRSRAFRKTLRGEACTTRALLSLGNYEATVQVSNLLGEIASAQTEMPVRDLLIVSLGDSLSSGEGNLDQPAILKTFTIPSGIFGESVTVPGGSKCDDLDDDGVGQDEIKMAFNPDFSVPLERSAGWVDRRCHRSKTSAPALAAQAIENGDDHTSVTFVSLACSGASLRSGILDPYAGQERVAPSDEPVALLNSQIEEVQTWLPIDLSMRF